VTDVLYITHDGITDHIGRSQIAPYLLGLAKRGYSIHVLSAEKPGRNALVNEYRRQFDAAGVGWTTVPYSNRFSLLSFLIELYALRRAASKIIRAEGVRMVHSRCFPSTLAAYPLKRKHGVKLLFDFRDFWLDSRLDTRRFKAPYHLLKLRERNLVRAADKIVCLTHRAVDILIERHLLDRARPGSLFRVIPCCADFDLFDAESVAPQARQAALRRARLGESGFVLLYLGSLGADYLLREMLLLFRQAIEIDASARFLFVSNNGRTLVDSECARLGIDPAAVKFISADRAEVPAYLTLADCSVVFVRSSMSKAGCSPTKLAELFACGVPVVANAGVGDMDDIISLERNGSIIVRDFDELTLRAALYNIQAAKAKAIPIRANSREFSLETGVDAYAQLYSDLMGTTQLTSAPQSRSCWTA
jgi:glycosyltransferase involved in cell wall biosynthesis